MNTILDKIKAYKLEDVARRKKERSLAEVEAAAHAADALRGFAASLDAKVAAGGYALIAEIKKASPSKGLIRSDFNPPILAEAYERGGAACLSVLTDGPGFMGSNSIFGQVRATTSLPLLRKDFLLDPIQVAESAAMGADCILIIMGMIDDDTAKALYEEATSLGLDSLIETHDESELERAVKLGGPMIGINNRDLRTFDTTLETFATLAPKAPKNCTLIAESGIFTREDIEQLAGQGAQGYLIGESLMRQDDVAEATRLLTGQTEHS
jgi:indole-3-glycerol phosphate synthase